MAPSILAEVMPLWDCHVWVACHRRRAQLTSRSSMQQIGPPHAGVADKKVHSGQNFVRRRWWRFRQKVSDRPASGAQWQWWVKLGKAGKRWHGWPIQGLSRGADQTYGAHETIVEVKRGSIKNHVGSKKDAIDGQPCVTMGTQFVWCVYMCWFVLVVFLALRSHAF